MFPNTRKWNFWASATVFPISLTALASFYVLKKWTQKEKNMSNSEKNGQKIAKISVRKRHFENFASVGFNGQIYMTPRDFIGKFTTQCGKMRNLLSLMKIFVKSTL